MQHISSLPPTVDKIRHHPLSSALYHDDKARLNFLTVLNTHLGRSMAPYIQLAFEHESKPLYKKQYGRPPKTSKEVRDALKSNQTYQTWSALRRDTQESSQRATRYIALLCAKSVLKKIKVLQLETSKLKLNPSLQIPMYQTAIDNHLMPGSYFWEQNSNDVTAAINYELSLFPVGGASFGPFGDGAGRAVSKFLSHKFPKFSPQKILDLGGGIGINTIALAKNFPNAEICVIDTAAPMLRYGHAIAHAMGYKNISFVQANAEDIKIPHNNYDLITSIMFWHETSSRTITSVLPNIYNLLKPNGITIHLEQPNFNSSSSPFSRFMQNWDAYYNNEPFWQKFHQINMLIKMEESGFIKSKIFEAGTEVDIEQDYFQKWSNVVARHKHETSLRNIRQKNTSGYNGERWWLFGARK